MEHKQPKPRQKKVHGLEPCHHCGFGCQHYTEEQIVNGLVIWEEHCHTGCSYEHMRHTIDCPKWDERRFDYA